MARRLPRTGRGIASLNERTPFVEAMVADGRVAANEAETTLDQVIAELGLHPLSTEDEQTVRLRIGVAISAWQSDLARPPVKDTKKSKVAEPTKGVQSTLEATAKHLEEAERVLRAHQTAEKGNDFQTEHNIQVVSLIQLVLDYSQTPEVPPYVSAETGPAPDLVMDLQAALGPSSVRDDYLGDLCQRMRKVADACHCAAKNCDAIPGKPGRDRFDWYTDFTRALMFIAKKNGIPPTVIRSRGLVVGPFVELAEAFERLCPPGMRSPSRDAVGKRLERAMKALRPY